jgi:integrase
MAANRSKARNGEGGIYSRELVDGTVVYDVSISFIDPKSGGRRRKLQRGFRSEAEAVQWKAANSSKGHRGRYVPPAKETVASYLATYLATADHKVQTRFSNETKIRIHVNPIIGHIPLSNLRATDLDRLYAHLKAHPSPGGKGKPLSASSIRKIHNILSGAFRHAVRKGLLEDNPCRRADPPSAREAKPREFTVWSADEVRRFLEATSVEPLDQRFFRLYHFLITTGVRRGEALGLRWQDVNLDAGWASIRQTIGSKGGQIIRENSTKTDKPRVIQLDEGTVAVLRAHKAEQAAQRLALGDLWQDEGLVFARDGVRLQAGTAAPGGPIGPERVSQAFAASVKRHGLPKIRLHDMRHTWATLAIANGVPPKVVQERLGHTAINTTLTFYAHVTPGMDREAAEKVASLFA